jgi:D-sedoheptulose 7-phosphate isomerase
MNNLDRMFQSAGGNSRDYAHEYLQYLGKVLEAVDRDEITKFIDIVLEARLRNAAIIFIGNGGSAATASHFSNDLAIGTRCEGRPFRAISLTDNNAVMTAIANDDGYEEVFLQQLKTVMLDGDVVVAISASGNSPNLLNAIQYANDAGATTIGLTAFDGGALKKLAKHSVHIPTETGEYGPAEDAHIILDHLVSSYLMRHVKVEAEKGQGA